MASWGPNPFPVFAAVRHFRPVPIRSHIDLCLCCLLLCQRNIYICTLHRPELRHHRSCAQRRWRIICPSFGLVRPCLFLSLYNKDNINKKKKLSVHKITISAKKSVQTSGICVSHMPGLVSATEDIVSFITLISVDNDLNKKEKKDNANLLWKYLGQKRGIAYDECGICKTRCPFIDTAENCRYMADYYIDCYFFFCLFFSLWFTVLGNSSLLQRRNLASTSRVKRLNRLFFPLKREAVENITRKGERQTENLGCVLPVNSRRAARGGFYGRIN